MRFRLLQVLSRPMNHTIVSPGSSLPGLHNRQGLGIEQKKVVLQMVKFSVCDFLEKGMVLLLDNLAYLLVKILAVQQRGVKSFLGG